MEQNPSQAIRATICTRINNASRSFLRFAASWRDYPCSIVGGFLFTAFWSCFWGGRGIEDSRIAADLAGTTIFAFTGSLVSFRQFKSVSREIALIAGIVGLVITHKFSGTVLPDARLKRRLTRVLEQLSAQPTASIPAASGTWADMKAAYRFFDHDRVDAVNILDRFFDHDRVDAVNILDGHSRATLRRIAAEPVVLLVQDTMFLSDIRDLQGRGVGMLRVTKRAECLLYLSVAFSQSRVN